MAWPDGTGIRRVSIFASHRLIDKILPDAHPVIPLILKYALSLNENPRLPLSFLPQAAWLQLKETNTENHARVVCRLF